MDLYFALLSFLSIFVISEAAIVFTERGFVEGSVRTTEAGVQYHSFQGIPYARPPIGGLRFRDAIPPAHWRLQAPLNCTVEGPPFWGIGAAQPSFDSLHVNVYTNDLNPPTPYPVMVWIHGGGWQSGSGGTQFYGPDYLVEQNVTIVTMNYRLLAFGFLSLDDPDLYVPGNQAFKDQRMALRWVQRNIAYFGGDPNQVTLFGQSSGGGSVHYHMISESSRGLFHRAILMAGSALHNGYSVVPRNNWAQRLASSLNFQSTNEREILTFLENAPPADIVLASSLLLTQSEINDGLILAFGPTIEPYDTEGVFLNDDIPTLVRNAWGNNINMLIGGTSMETLDTLQFIRLGGAFLDFFANFGFYIPRELELNRTGEEALGHAQRLQENYYGQLIPTVTNADGMLFALADSYLWFPAHRTVRYRMQSQQDAHTFVYRFDADSQNNVFREILVGVDLYRQPTHGDDLAHLFKTVLHMPRVNMNQLSLNTLNLMVSLFTNFAKTGNPNDDPENPFWYSIEQFQEAGNLEQDVYLVGYNIKENSTSFGTLPEAATVRTHDVVFGAVALSNAETFLTLGIIKLSLLVAMKYLAF
ncbi:CLUMA_CG016384, isoform A [Clunio marinus]|uniref:Carboxylic ester hydrolase n=1 Tax=Clunio marinus TaxID=568069 RepID=A0A1J1IUY2_9DIPT|nr:CLUMA_CG016384, isoform A [Clunio marinus]